MNRNPHLDHADLGEIYQLACELLEADGYSATRRQYSGRAMYGREVPAISTDAPESAVGIAVYRAATDLFHDEVKAKAAVPGRSDAMGKSRIFY